MLVLDEYKFKGGFMQLPNLCKSVGGFISSLGNKLAGMINATTEKVKGLWTRLCGASTQTPQGAKRGLNERTFYVAPSGETYVSTSGMPTSRGSVQEASQRVFVGTPTGLVFVEEEGKSIPYTMETVNQEPRVFLGTEEGTSYIVKPQDLPPAPEKKSFEEVLEEAVEELFFSEESLNDTMKSKKGVSLKGTNIQMEDGVTVKVAMHSATKTQEAETEGVLDRNTNGTRNKTEKESYTYTRVVKQGDVKKLVTLTLLVSKN